MKKLKIKLIGYKENMKGKKNLTSFFFFLATYLNRV
jgi:hypothetical protein